MSSTADGNSNIQVGGNYTDLTIRRERRKKVSQESVDILIRQGRSHVLQIIQIILLVSILVLIGIGAHRQEVFLNRGEYLQDIPEAHTEFIGREQHLYHSGLCSICLRPLVDHNKWPAKTNNTTTLQLPPRSSSVPRFVPYSEKH